MHLILQVLDARLSSPSPAAAGGVLLFFVAPCAWLRVLDGIQARCADLQRLLQGLGARLSSPSAAAASGAMLLFVAPYVWLRVLTEAQVCLLQVLRARLSPPVDGDSRWRLAFFVARRAWPRVLLELGRGTYSPRAPVSPPAGARRKSFVPVGVGSRWRHSIFCRTARLAACLNST